MIPSGYLAWLQPRKEGVLPRHDYRKASSALVLVQEGEFQTCECSNRKTSSTSKAIPLLLQ